ncbi:glycosyltransferase family 2 protein [Planococcus chinensis]|uniref:Glycosyltransferase family 2 protein n=1 Tax=Planococcus chinensis TaxID=272917 RepID=A0ABW4QEJ1_9BACL
MLVSLIIPVYNSERYIERCLNSVIKQSYYDIEIILVNDGSFDNSKSICLSFAKRDKRITYIEKENGGVSSARNVGLTLAKGKYIGFIDADDIIEEKMIEEMMNLHNRTKKDVLICGIEQKKNFERKEENYLNRNIIKMDSVEAINNMLNVYEYQGYVCNKLFSSKLIKGKKKITFDESIHTCEDMLFCTEAFLRADVIMYDKNKYYKYLIHGENTSLKYSSKKLSAIKAYKKILTLIYNHNEIRQDKFHQSYFYLILSLLMQSKDSKTDKDTVLFREITNIDPKQLKKWNTRILYYLLRKNSNIIYFAWKIKNYNLNNQNLNLIGIRKKAS